MKKKEKALSKIQIKPLIKTIRGRKVILDSDLAKIYGVSTKRLNEQVKRNADRFPADFAFQIAPEEVVILRSQTATSSSSGTTMRSQIATSSTHVGYRSLIHVLIKHRCYGG